MSVEKRINDSLGQVNSDIKKLCYEWLKNNGMSVAKCGRSDHEGDRLLPVEKFNLLNVSKARRGDGGVDFEIIKVQGYCISCERRYRKNRLDKNNAKYSTMTIEQIHDNYKAVYGKDTMRCSRCKGNLPLNNFTRSNKMECGLHNVCVSCSKDYADAVGDRIIKYSPDFNFSKKTKRLLSGNCNICGLHSENFHIDHIFPLSKGGTDHGDNLQNICDKCNLSKSDKIYITKVSDIKKTMICERYHSIFDLNISDMNDFEISICEMVSKFIKTKDMMTDSELKNFYAEYNKKNKLRKSVDRCLEKFRKYIKRNDI